ncbi:MAG: redoxin domain-containing protein [Candidatus Pacebacteria bacterium]|nr:redoxin domain-containing protein [Candidatus Paceibacterota bacterium]
MENFEMMDMHPMRIGDSLPELELDVFYQGEEQKLQSANYEGKWQIFFFYPADFTFVCPTELEELADMYAEFQAENAEIFSVSTDTVFAHKAWKDVSPAIKKVEFPMVADPTGEICELFGTYIYDEGISLRGTFIVSPDGELVAMEINNNDIGRSGKELLRKLKAAKFVAEHGGQVCPASWEPGSDTLEPGMDLVGKI